MGAVKHRGYSFGTFGGVFTPSILTIIGVIMYLRFGWVLGQVGLAATLLIVTLSSSITFLTGLAISALATNMRVEAGGAYYMISRSLGVEAGAAIGIPLFFAQAISVAFYSVGFAEALTASLCPAVDPRWVALVTIAILGVVASRSAGWAIKAQYLIMALIVLSLLALFFGRAPDPAVLVRASEGDSALRPGFWAVLAVFFPAVTGILAGVGMSGDLKNPRRSLPLGTLAAVLTGYAIYMAVPVFLRHFIPDDAVLRTDMLVFEKCARVRILVILGVWAATLSSALGSILSAPRTLQALANDRVLPRALGRGWGPTNDPRLATFATLLVAFACVFLGGVSVLAPVLTMFFLTTYCLLCLSAGCEELMGNPSWRPTFRVPAPVLLFGAAACAAMMIMIGPGQAIVALLCVSGIYWGMRRRALGARWGDIRAGILTAFVRFALRRLARIGSDNRFRSWRPNLLVFVGVPTRRWRLVAVADAISRNKSIVTLASVVPASFWTADRADRFRDVVRRALAARHVEALVLVQPGSDHWTGAADLVRSYGLGSLVPNTILLGMPTRGGSEAELGGLALLVAARRRNLVILQEGRFRSGLGAPSPRIDVWWRGRRGNGSFLLALAWLINGHRDWAGARLRVCCVAEPGESAAAVRVRESAFLQNARIAADVIALPPDSRPALARIAEVSGASTLVLLGLRAPFVGETAAAYGDYLASLREATAALPLVLFALATEDVDFRGIFRA